MIKKMYLIVSLGSFFIESHIMSMDGRYYRFGCSNKQQCQYRGIVDRNDPYCEQCEFEKYPERFVACLFCRKPLRKALDGPGSSSCFECAQNMELFLVDQLFVKCNDNDGMHAFHDAQHKRVLKEGIKAYLLRAKKEVHCRYIKDFYLAHPHRDIFRATPGETKPHIYLGAKKGPNGGLLHMWTKDLKIRPEDKKKVLDVDEATKHVAIICLKYKVCGPQTGEITEHEVNNTMITYEELPDTQSQGNK